jgi:peptide/nickel transport system substrate-binding protein
MVRSKTVVALAAVTSLGLVGCGGGSSSGSASGSAGGSSGPSGSIVLGSLVQPTSYAANGAGWANEALLQQAVYDTLVHADPDGKIVPWLATSWTYNADKTVLTLKLRTDVTFTDGTKLDADAAAKNLIRFREGTAPNKSFLTALKDAKAVDAGTLELTLSAPDPAMLTYLSQAPGLMESPKHFGAADEKTNPVGSGPYVLDTAKTVVGSSYAYTANPTYFAKDQQHWANLTIKVFSTPATEVNAIKGGQVDGMNLLDSTTAPQVKGAGFTLVDHELDWSGLAIFDRGGKLVPALKDPKVRQAINYAVDRNGMLKAAAQGNGTVTSSVFPTYSPGFDAAVDAKYTYDPAKAKALLAEAGFPTFEMTLPQVPGFGQVQNDLLKQYLGAVGITVKYVTVPINNVIADILAGKYAAANFQLQEDPTAWQEANFLLTTNATFNPFKVADPKVDAWVKTLQTGSDADAATATKELNAYVVDQGFMAPYYRLKGFWAQSSKISAKAQAGNVIPYLYSITPTK